MISCHNATFVGTCKFTKNLSVCNFYFFFMGKGYFFSFYWYKVNRVGVF